MWDEVGGKKIFFVFCFIVIVIVVKVYDIVVLYDWLKF